MAYYKTSTKYIKLTGTNIQNPFKSSGPIIKPAKIYKVNIN
jgi:hypothetical protein